MKWRNLSLALLATFTILTTAFTTVQTGCIVVQSANAWHSNGSDGALIVDGTGVLGPTVVTLNQGVTKNYTSGQIINGGLLIVAAGSPTCVAILGFSGNLTIDSTSYVYSLCSLNDNTYTISDPNGYAFSSTVVNGSGGGGGNSGADVNGNVLNYGNGPSGGNGGDGGDGQYDSEDTAPGGSGGPSGQGGSDGADASTDDGGDEDTEGAGGGGGGNGGATINGNSFTTGGGLYINVFGNLIGSGHISTSGNPGNAAGDGGGATTNGSGYSWAGDGGSGGDGTSGGNVLIRRHGTDLETWTINVSGGSGGRQGRGGTGDDQNGNDGSPGNNGPNGTMTKLTY